MTLDGMADVIRKAVSKRDKCNFVRYADDFIITAATRQILEEKVKPAIEKFLGERGLKLSEEKTLITDEGFDFLGFNVRKYKGKLLIKPSKKSVASLLDKIREIITSNKTTTSGKLIEQLNPIIRGWTNYYRHVVAKRIFAKIDSEIFLMIRRWCIRRHPNKNHAFWKEKYFRRAGLLNWIFFGAIRKPNGRMTIINLNKAGYTMIYRHTKIRSAVNLYDQRYDKYLRERQAKMRAKSKRAYAATKGWLVGKLPNTLLGQKLGF